ncbi:unnamed protein product [Closterium sp. NIES-53]
MCYTTLTPLFAPVLVRLADRSQGPVLARSSTVLLCPAVPSGSLSGLHLPSFSTNLVSTAALQDAMVTTSTTPGARVGGHGRDRYFLLVVDDYTRYTTVFPLRSKGEVPDVLVPWIRAVHLQLRERFCQDLPVCVCTLTEVLNIWPRVSFPETSPALRWTGKVGDASVFRVWSSRAFVCDTSEDKLSACAIPFVFLGFPPDAPGWQFYHPISHRVLPCQDVMFDKSVPFYRLFPYRSAPPPPPPLFLAPGAGAGDPGAGGAGAVDLGAGGAGARGAASGGTGAQVLGLPSSTGHTPPLLSPPPDQLQPPLQPASPLPAPSSYIEQTGGLTDHHEPVSRPASPVRAVRIGLRVPRQRPPPVPSKHHMALRPSSVPQRVPLPSPPASSLADGPDPESDLLVDFVAACPLDYAASLVAESESDYPPSVGGECALCTDILEDKQEDIECFAAVVPHLVSMLIAPEADTDAPDIPTPRSYAEVITVPPPGANIVDGMWIFRVERPPGSPHAFKARYVARGFCQQLAVYFFQNFPPTPNMTTLWVLLHVTAQRDYKLHSVNFSIAFLQGSLHEEIWLRRPPGFTGSFPAVLLYVDDLVFATSDTEALARVKLELQKRHTCTDLDELQSYLDLQITQDRARRTITLTLSHMVHQFVEPSGPCPELVGCLMYLMTCTRPDLAYPLSILARYVAPGRHRLEQWEATKRVLRYLCNTSGMGLVLEGRGPVVLTGHAKASWVDDLATKRSSQGYTLSLGSASISWRSIRLSSVLSSSCEAEIYAGALAAQVLCWLTYLLTDLGEQPCSPPVLYQRGQLRLAYVATRANTADIFTKALHSGDHQRFCIFLGHVPTLPHLLTA